MSNRVVHFEIPVDDTEKALKFYSDVFGWKMHQFGNEEYWMCFTGDEKEQGINGGIMKKRDPAQPIVNTIKVTNVDETAKKIEASGGQIVVPKMAIRGVGYLVYFKDTGGNIFGIMHDDKNAA